MSLINDALKRARVEARRQEETERRTYRAVPAHSRRPDRQRLLLLGGWGVAALAALLAVWMGLSPDPEGAREAAEPVRPAMATEASRGSSGEAPMEVRPAPVPEGSSGPNAEQPADDARAPGSQRIESADVPQAAPSDTVSSPGPDGADAVSSDPLPVASTPPPEVERRAAAVGGSVGRSRLQAGRTYLRSATAVDGSVVELGGIAYSDSRPIAVINGSVVASGDLIAGFTVVSIEPERVELEADGVRIFLALR